MDRHNSKLNKALLHTLVYSDVFNYPLNFEELHTYLYKYKIDSKNLKTYLQHVGFIKKVANYYVLLSREYIINTRIKRREETKRKMGIARQVVKVLHFVPTISLIGVSGSVAAGNADKNSDIDLFIITSKDSLWVTRIIVTLVLMIMRKKRAPLVTFSPDSICTNMWMSEDALTLPNRSVFHAREVVQLKVLFERNRAMSKFLNANKWVFSYFPNYKYSSFHNLQYKTSNTNLIWRSMDYFAFRLQSLYMKNKQTTERAQKKYAAFHPKDVSSAVIEVYSQRVKTYSKELRRVIYFNSDKKKLEKQDIKHITPGS